MKDTEKKRLSPLLKWAGVSLVVIGVFAYFLTRPESLLHAARAVGDCIDVSDAPCLIRYMRQEEAAMLGVEESPEELNEFLQSYYSTKLSGFVRDGSLAVTRDDPSLSLVATQMYHHPDGRVLHCTFAVALADDGPRLVGISQALVSTVMLTHVEAGKKKPTGEGAVRFYIESWEAELEALSRLKLKGYAALGTESQLEYRTWSQGLQKHRDRLASYENARNK